MSESEDVEILRAVLEKLDTGLYIVERDHKILFWNVGPKGLLDIFDRTWPVVSAFDRGSREPNQSGRDLLIALAQQLSPPNKVSVEGHTDANTYAQGSNYGN